MNHTFIKNNKASVLILVLWTLGLLTVFAVNVGMRTRQKIQVLSRLERRAGARSAAASGIHLARAVVTTELHKEGEPDLGARKNLWFNMPSVFQGIPLDQAVIDINYNNYDFGAGEPIRMYGIVDEERKLNINKADKDMLARLIVELFKTEDEETDDIVSAIIDWREYGESEIVGFYSDEYYDNLEFKYPEKKDNYENPDELSLVKGIYGNRLKVLSEFVTVYGKGAVNINTASRPVLKALGFSDEMVNAVFFVRTGPDAIEATEDDLIFLNTSAIQSLISSAVKMNTDEQKVLKELISKGFLGTKSDYFRAHSKGRLMGSGETAVIDCVFRADNGKIVYWKEK